MFKPCQWLTSRIHLNVKFISKPHILYRQEIKGNICKFSEQVFHRRKFFPYCIKHNKHRCDCCIMLPLKVEPIFVFDLQGRRRCDIGIKIFIHNFLTEITRRRSCLIAELLQEITFSGWHIFFL